MSTPRWSPRPYLKSGRWVPLVVMGAIAAFFSGSSPIRFLLVFALLVVLRRFGPQLRASGARTPHVSTAAAVAAGADTDLDGERLAGELEQVRARTLRLVADLADGAAGAASRSGERPPVWLMGHLLLGDLELLIALGAGEVDDEFHRLRSRYGAESPRGPLPDAPLALAARLAETGELRRWTVGALDAEELAQAPRDPVLAKTQPTLGHHLRALIDLEIHLAGQLAGRKPVRRDEVPGR